MWNVMYNTSGKLTCQFGRAFALQRCLGRWPDTKFGPLRQLGAIR